MAQVRTSRARFLWLSAAIALTGCATNPATGANQLMLVSEAQEIQMGQQADTAVIATIGLYPDAVWQRYIQQFGARLAATSERPNVPWTFRVVDDPAVNAFALPGGFIYVTRGLLAHLTDEAQLASYERLLDGLVFGSNPRQGYFTKSEFFHPDLRFRLTFPAGWTMTNQQGITSGPSARLSLSGGLSAVSAPFSAATEDGTLRGTVLFVDYGGAVYGLIGYAPEARWPTYQGTAERALQSFRALTDPAALSVQPQRVDILTLTRSTTIEQLARERSSSVLAATLALINQVQLQTPLASGRLVKWVVTP